MKKILFNNIRKSENYLRHFEYLFSDYDLFRKKHFSNLCLQLLQPVYPSSKLFLTHSATGALEIISHLIDIQAGDEVIMPSFTFVSTANAFVSHGATPVFVDIDPETLNLDVSLIEAEITPRTKAIVAVHYAGHGCDMKRLSEICKKHKLYLVEDAAMGFGNKYEGIGLGAYGDFGVISFDITKHVSAVQGGLLLVNNPSFASRADNIYHIGTNRSDFMEGNVAYYEWVDVGSKFQMSELNAAFLYEQLQKADSIFAHRKKLSAQYYGLLSGLSRSRKFAMMPEALVDSNIHEFYLVLADEQSRNELSAHLLSRGIESLFHYIPLHESAFGRKRGVFTGGGTVEKVSSGLLRLPMHSEITEVDVAFICDSIFEFFEEEENI